MGTTYKLLETDEAELECHEMSNRFSISICDANADYAELRDLTPEQLVQAGAELLKIASYFMEAGAIQDEIDRHVKEKGGYAVGVAV